jgi:hypothetical protein
MGVFEDNVTGKDGKLDPYALLFHSVRNRRKFSKYIEAFEEFVIQNSELLLDLARHYLEPQTVIPMIGRSEIVNIEEFKHSQPQQFRITVEAVSTDAETMLGKQLAMNHTLQFVGSQLDKDEIGRILRSMPFINEEEAFTELTIDYDNSKNDILALERGDQAPPNRFDNHIFVIKRLTHRMKQPDFKFLDPQIQQNFERKRQMHMQLDAEQKAAILRAQQGLIPTDGYLVVCDFYVSNDEGKTKRVRLPFSSIKWLIEQLQAQGNTLDDLERMNQGALSELSTQISSRLGPNQAQTSGREIAQDRQLRENTKGNKSRQNTDNQIQGAAGGNF